MDIILVPLLQVVRALLDLYNLGLFIFGILMMLESFNIVDSYGKTVYKIHSVLFAIYNPVLEKIRNVFNFGTFDFSAMILFIIIYFFRQILIRIIDLF